MKKSRWIHVLAVYALFILIGLGNIGGCETTESGQDDDPDLRTCDLTGSDAACEACAEQGAAACCTLTSTPGCGTVDEITQDTTCKSDLQAACLIGTEPTPAFTPVPTPAPTPEPRPNRRLNRRLCLLQYPHLFRRRYRPLTLPRHQLQRPGFIRLR